MNNRKIKILKFFIDLSLIVCALLLFFTHQDFFLILFIICSIVCFWVYMRQTPPPKNTLLCITGSPGTGKTRTGTTLAIKAYRRQNLLYKLNKLSHGLLALYIPKASHEPHLYSNIPICIGRKNKRPVFCDVLRSEHLLMTEQLPEYCTVFIDEIGSFAGQWEYDNPFVQTNLQIFIRFFRHFIGSENRGLIMTEQSSDFIAKVIRDRVGLIINMTECRRVWGFLPIQKLSYCELLSVEGTSSVLTTATRKLPYIALFTPYKWMPQRRKVYESRCYKYLYRDKAQKHLDSFDEYYTRYLVDISAGKEDRKLYQSDKKRYMDEYLYEDEKRPERK